MNELKSISIKDLKGPTSTSQVEVNISDLKPTRVKEDANKEYMDNAFDMLDSAMDRVAKEAAEFVEKVEEEDMQEKMEKELESEESTEDIEEISLSIEEDTKTEKVVSLLDIDEDDFDIDDEDEEIKADDEKQITEMKSKLKEKIKPVAKIIDLSTMTISSKPMSISNALKPIATSKTVIDWILPAEGRSISIEGFTGIEIEDLNPKNSSRNRINTYKDIYELLFNHIIDTNKPATMEQWVKKLNFFDLDHLFFAVYKSSFEGANFIPYSCPHCNEVFISDNVEIDSMVKYKDDTIKEKMIELLNSDSSSVSQEYNVELVQVSDTYAIGLREPSVYSIIFENAILDQKFTDKYNKLLSLISFIDSIYFIDVENGELRPIEPKEYLENIVKNVKSKVSTYSKILQSLNSDQFYQFNAYINAIQERHDEVTYMLPATKCPKCSKEIKEADMAAEDLLFTRHQLTGIANI